MWGDRNRKDSTGQAQTQYPITLIDRDGKTRNGRILEVKGFHGLQRIPVELATAGDIVCISGIDKLNISDTLCHPDRVEALPPLKVDEPTISMTFQVNDSPLRGKRVNTLPAETSRIDWIRS